MKPSILRINKLFFETLKRTRVKMRATIANGNGKEEDFNGKYDDSEEENGFEDGGSVDDGSE